MAAIIPIPEKNRKASNLQIPLSRSDQIEDAMKMAIKIEGAIKIACESHNIQFAQVWIASWDKNHFPVLSTPKKQLVAFNLTSFVAKHDFPYSYFAHMDFLDTRESLVEKTLEDYEPRFFITCDIYPEMVYPLLNKPKVNVLVICLKSLDIGDICYAFEFIWDYNLKSGISLEDLLLTLKRCLPSFKFGSGAELRDELHVIDVENSARFKIFEGKQVSLGQGSMKGPKLEVVGDTSPSEAKCKTNPVEVSPSTLKRKCKEHERPLNPTKRKVNQSRNQNDTNEEDSGAIRVPSPSEKLENILTIKAEYSDDMIRFDLLMSDATFVIVEREIGKRFELTTGIYKLKYCDEDSDWISLTSEQDMVYCIRCSKRLDRTLVRLRVLPSA
ncbi:uncharacterized protein [Rutidosis leptorrhynchoides]|uniref:uncharacterized protein isoform X2 n=1 Tax=Rutidosis leptorrhynchoides TaxID=125765 RepID=UPI003A9A25C0